MRKKWKNYLILCVILAFLALLYPQPAFAHKMIIDHDEEGSIHVRYDDGTPAGIAQVTVYDGEGQVLFEREADDNGTLKFDKELQVHRITADDGMGHRASWTNEEEASFLEDIPLFVRALFGISILLFLAAIFLLRTNKKPKEGEKN